MKKVLTVIFSCLILFSGCTKREPDPVIVNFPVGEEADYALPETAVSNLSNEYISGTGGQLFVESEGPLAPETDVGVVNSEVKVSVTVEKKPDVIYVPTPNDVVAKMLEMAQVRKDDLLYDLGCGDGRIVVTAAKKIGCRAVGFDIDPKRIKESLDNVARNKVGHLVSIEQKDIFTLDLSKANVITLYLLPSLNVRLIPQLEKLKDGSRIVSHDFRMRGVKPDKIVKMKSVVDGAQHKVFLWTTPLRKRKTQDSNDVGSEFILDYGMFDMEDWIRSSDIPVSLIKEP
jgi:hypothetical protein